MHWKQTLVLLAVAGALAFYVYVSEMRPGSAIGSLEEMRERAETVFYGFEAGLVDGVVIQGAGAQGAPAVVEIRRRGDVWELVRSADGGRAPAKGSEVLRVVGRLVALRRRRALEARELAEFGLSPPLGRVTLVADGRQRTVAFGALDATQKSRFAMVEGDGEPEVFTVEGSLVEDVLSAVGATEEWVERRLVPLAQESVEAIEIVREDGGRVGVERAGRRWELAAPLRARADRAEVEKLLGKLLGIEVDKRLGFVGYGREAIARWGLTQPLYTVRLRKTGGGTLSLRFARAVDPADPDAPERLVAASSDYDAVAVVAGQAEEALRVAPEQLRSREIMGVEPEEAKVVTLSWRGAQVRAEKRGGGWWIVEPAEREADEEAVEAFLKRLSALRIDRFDPPGAGELKVEATVALEWAGPSQREDILFGAAAEAGKVLVKSTVQEDVVEARGVLEVLFPTGALDWRARTLAETDRERLLGFEIVKKDRTYRVERDGREWALGLPTKGKADRESAQGVVEVFSRFRVKRYVEADVQDFERFGLAEPRMTVRLELVRMGETPSGQMELRVGSKGPQRDEWFATLDIEKGLVFTIDSEVFAKLDAEMIDREILAFERAALVSITIAGVRMTPRGDAWEAQDLPAGEKLRAEKVERAVETLRRLRAERFVTVEKVADLERSRKGEPDLEHWPADGGTGEGTFEVRLEVASGGKVDEPTLWIGRAGEGGRRRAVLSGDGRMFELSAEDAKRLALRRDELVGTGR